MAKGKHEEWITDEGLIKLEAWARDGLVDVDIAKKMNINPATLYVYKKKFPEISEALKRGKEVVDAKVENALLKRALGFEYTKETHERVLNKDTGEYEFVLTKKVDVVVNPDTTAQIFWLKNRMPDKWRDKREVNLESNLDNTTDLTDEELTAEIKKVQKELGVEDG